MLCHHLYETQNKIAVSNQRIPLLRLDLHLITKRGKRILQLRVRRSLLPPSFQVIKTTASSKSFIFECGKISTGSEIKDVNKAEFSIVFFTAVLWLKRCVTSLKAAELQHVGVRLPSSK